MRKVDKLLLTAIIPPFLIGLAVLTFIVFMDRLGRLSELLITRNASVETVLVIASTIAPGVLIFSLPLSFLIGTLIGLSGLSGESQITALRACGVSLRRMLRPVVGLSILVGLVTGVMSLYVLPETNDIYDSLKTLVSVRQATSLIVPRVFNEEFSNVVFYLDDLSIDRKHWDRVFLADNSDLKNPRIVLAREGTWISDPGGTRLQLHLENGAIYEVNPQDPTKDNISLFGSTDLPINLNHGGATEADKGARKKNPAQQTTLELLRGSAGTDAQQRRDELVQLHQRLALPCSALGFALVGLSMGIRTRRGGRTYGSVISLVLVMLFWVIFWNGSRLASVGALPLWLGVWGADLIQIGVGLTLLVIAERHGRVHQTIVGWRLKADAERLARRLHLGSIRATVQKLDDFAISSTIRTARTRLPKVLDSYISRGFLAYFLWSGLVCYLLFVVLTLFDLLDEIIRNRIAVVIVVRYFIFLTPQILLYVVPMSVLLAILIMFGILEKGSEVTAMKAGGWSLYRISLPVFLISGFICASIFFMQDYILPYANKEQDALRNLIKAKPVQTTTKPRTWIFGESDRIFNYDYFDPNKDVFIGLNIYEVDLRQQAIKRRVYARRATIDPQGEWTLEDGWVRNFQPRQVGFVPIKKATFDFPETASYFEKEIFAPKESSKLTYLELRKYIDYLKQSGYNATELLVELHKKISFPVSCFVMALLGVPFSFFMGRKGAFFGITASVAIAMSYWLVFNVFEQMGAYGMLSPVLAAWAPNLLFGAAGLAMLFTIRT
ncbi:MAG: LPS export ABC transporter permease LptG [Acidobacteriota bacterium]|jgi:LPS export ABC transporter permease LptG/LPS export ABC transporter permease LptF